MGVGHRRDEDIRALGRMAGNLFEEIIIRFDEDSRGWDTDQIADLIKQGVWEVDDQKPMHVIPDELAALTYTIEHVQDATMIVHFSDRIHRSIELVREFKQLEETVEHHPTLMV